MLWHITGWVEQQTEPCRLLPCSLEGWSIIHEGGSINRLWLLYFGCMFCLCITSAAVRELCRHRLSAHSLKPAGRIQQQDVGVCRLHMCLICCHPAVLEWQSFSHEPGLMFSNFCRNSLTRGWMSCLITRCCRAESPNSWHRQLPTLLELHITIKGRMWSLILGGKRWGRSSLGRTTELQAVNCTVIVCSLVISSSCRKLQSPEVHKVFQVGIGSFQEFFKIARRCAWREVSWSVKPT